MKNTRKKTRTPYRRAYETLTRIPDDVLLTTVTAIEEMGDPDRCLVGTAVRQELLAIFGQEGPTYSTLTTIPHCARDLFGGRLRDWLWIFSNVDSETNRFNHSAFPHIERAYVNAVSRAVARSK